MEYGKEEAKEMLFIVHSLMEVSPVEGNTLITSLMVLSEGVYAL